jgi:hypothetical protein
LEWVAQQKGFMDNVQGPLYKILPDYVLPGVSNQALASILAGLAGVVIVLGMALGVAFLRRTRRETDG